MHTYRRITYEDRCQIHALRKAGITQAESGKVLGVSQGTVSRELSRNTGQRGDHFQQAQRTAQSRQAQVRHKPRKLTRRVRRAITRKLRVERWIPEQISCWLRDACGISLSHDMNGSIGWSGAISTRAAPSGVSCDAVARNITGVGHSTPAAA